MSLFDLDGLFHPGLEAGEALSEGRFVTISASTIVMADAQTAAVIGVTAKACTSGHFPVLQRSGKVRVQAGGSVSVGDQIEATTDGKGITAGGATAYSLGQALSAAADGEFFTCLVNLPVLAGPANS